MKQRSVFIILFFFIFCTGIQAQSQNAPFSDEIWDFSGAQTNVATYMGKSGIKVAQGYIFLKDVAFINGTIEVDINFPGRRNFPGIGFRVQDVNNHEHFYVRPHQSGNPDACQYTPIFNGLPGWQLYHGEGYGTPLELVPDQWHHLRIEIKSHKAQVFWNDMETPAMDIPHLKREIQAGTLGLNAGGPVHFANFAYSIDNTSYPANATSDVSDPKLIRSWELSEALENELFNGKTQISEDLLSKMQWKTRLTEPSGLMNLARYTARAEGKSTVVAKLTVSSEEDEVQGLAFGYSDQVSVYVNGKLQYQGSNQYRSRDYRYLGTIGFFDAVYLDLKKGDNEVWFVVTENFGGWGIQAKFL